MSSVFLFTDVTQADVFRPPGRLRVTVRNRLTHALTTEQVLPLNNMGSSVPLNGGDLLTVVAEHLPGFERCNARSVLSLRDTIPVVPGCYQIQLEHADATPARLRALLTQVCACTKRACQQRSTCSRHSCTGKRGHARESRRDSRRCSCAVTVQASDLPRLRIRVAPCGGGSTQCNAQGAANTFLSRGDQYVVPPPSGFTQMIVSLWGGGGGGGGIVDEPASAGGGGGGGGSTLQFCAPLATVAGWLLVADAIGAGGEGGAASMLVRHPGRSGTPSVLRVFSDQSMQTQLAVLTAYGGGGAGQPSIGTSHGHGGGGAGLGGEGEHGDQGGRGGSGGAIGVAGDGGAGSAAQQHSDGSAVNPGLSTSEVSLLSAPELQDVGVLFTQAFLTALSGFTFAPGAGGGGSRYNDVSGTVAGGAGGSIARIDTSVVSGGVPASGANCANYGGGGASVASSSGGSSPVAGGYNCIAPGAGGGSDGGGSQTGGTGGILVQLI